MDRLFDLSEACVTLDVPPACPQSSHHCGHLTTGGSCHSNKRHRSLNALARHEKIILPPLPIMTKPGHKKENSSPTSITDWDVNDHLGSSELQIKKIDSDSLEIIFSPRHLAPIRLHRASCVGMNGMESKRRSSSPSDFVNSRCACSILKEKFSFRLKQEQLLPSSTASSSL